MSCNVNCGAPSALAVFTCDARAEAVRVRDVPVLPRAATTGDPVLADLAGRDHQHAPIAVHRVAVDVDVEELVVLTDPLQRLEVIVQHVGTPQADVRDRRGVRPHVLRRHRRTHPPGLRDDPVEAERLSRGVDVPLDVRALALELLRVHPEGLDECRIGRARNHRNEREQADGDHRQRPSTQPDVHEEQRTRAR
jgi:hypothetical protein